MRIYALMSGQLVLYVGKTKISLKDRAYTHKNKGNTTCSKYIPKYIDWEIVLLDEVPDEEGLKWEQHYYDLLMPLYNYKRPGQTKKEYAKEWRKTEYAKEKHRIHQRARYHRNKANKPVIEPIIVQSSAFPPLKAKMKLIIIEKLHTNFCVSFD